MTYRCPNHLRSMDVLCQQHSKSKVAIAYADDRLITVFGNTLYTEAVN